jgi:hypothetical protein
MCLSPVLHSLLDGAKKTRGVTAGNLFEERDGTINVKSFVYFRLLFFIASVLNLVPSSLICTILISSQSVHVNKNVSMNNDEENRLDEHKKYHQRRSVTLIFVI